MKTVRASIMLGVLALALLAAAQAQTQYTYQKINVPNGTQTFPRGVNARGDIFGSYIDADGVGHDFLLRNGVYTNIDYPGGAAASALAINARGDIVGGLDDADGSHGFLLSDGNLTLIDYPGASSTRAFGINNAGDITGTYRTAFDFPRGFILSGGKFRNVSLPGGTDLGVRGSQDNGLTMVGDELIKSDGSTRGFVRNKPSDVLLLEPTGTVFPVLMPVERTSAVRSSVRSPLSMTLMVATTGPRRLVLFGKMACMTSSILRDRMTLLHSASTIMES